MKMRLPKTIADGLFVLILLTSMSFDVFATDPGRIGVGDTVVVAADATELHVKGNTIVRLRKDARLTVVEVHDNWVGGSAQVNGEKQKGWVLGRKIYKPDDPSSARAWQKYDVKVETDYLGNVLRIDANDSKIPGDALQHLRGLYNLEGLELSGTDVRDTDLKHLRGLTNLRWLYLDNTRVTDEGLAHLKDLVRLDVLALHKSQLVGPGLAHLERLSKLRVLNLSECKINDDALVHLKHFRAIQTLALQQTPINGSGLLHLQSMKRLNVLNLNKCKLASKTLLHLKPFKELRILHLEDAEVDQSDVDELDEALASLAVFD